ncbi:hypothetical protein BVG19_g2430 [[Candida] boidinii]|nr:hypothetical protein BVG19_g2430 [[Candida] boidinii]OWB49090.1 hypothetical protein B5S27_g629 [[Candida] boidinii]OWB83994.1 hypothetical protein B5S33_g2630 [[Candida] boidinii]
MSDETVNISDEKHIETDTGDNKSVKESASEVKESLDKQPNIKTSERHMDKLETHTENSKPEPSNDTRKMPKIDDDQDDDYEPIDVDPVIKVEEIPRHSAGSDFTDSSSSSSSAAHSSAPYNDDRSRSSWNSRSNSHNQYENNYKRKRVIKQQRPQNGMSNRRDNRYGSPEFSSRGYQQRNQYQPEYNNSYNDNNSYHDNSQQSFQNSPPPTSERPAWMPDHVFQQQQNSLVQSQKVTDRNNEFNDYSANARPYDNEPNASSQFNHNSHLSQDEKVRLHYNQRTFQSRREKRTESKILKLRSFNNCIKYILINKFAKTNGTVLDLGCGKGGDMAKWDSINTENYVGIDISDFSIKEAVKRYSKSRYKFHAIFLTGDAFKTPVPKLLTGFEDQVPPDYQFDTVSMQFCLHYAFESEETIRSLLENVSKSLKVGGMFIGTIPSSDFIKWKFEKLKPDELKWGNSIYSVEFPQKTIVDGSFVPTYGNTYTYFLVDAVDNVPEFVVPFEVFRGLCEEYNLELRFKKNFIETFNTEIPKWFQKLPKPLLDHMRRPDGTYGVSGDDKGAALFYLAFAFEKVGYE